ncbi:DUF2834 domain-containing protein [Sphingomonas bacterium]|uniref:DUF2834 domain-containing protein n=1 Tax=Sphingomonas bacterium TaxID=1895847 RepID=UPI001C2DB7C7|nr:DUF2834 domain-containing protein [Sphingomonas bacterium]
MRRGKLLTAYIAFAVAGTVLPLVPFVSWVAANGLDVGRFLGDLFVNRISSFFAFDVIVSAVVVILFVIVQAKRDRVGHAWVAIAATLLVGGSSGLPIFLALRERALRS